MTHKQYNAKSGIACYMVMSLFSLCKCVQSVHTGLLLSTVAVKLDSFLLLSISVVSVFRTGS